MHIVTDIAPSGSALQQRVQDGLDLNNFHPLLLIWHRKQRCRFNLVNQHDAEQTDAVVDDNIT